MSTLLIDDTHVDEAMLLSVVDEEFRALVAASPDAFGLTSLPVAVEPPERGLWEYSAGSQYIAQCASTCSKGPFTVLCDGTTK